MATRRDRLDQIAQIPLFSACSQRELSRVVRTVDEITVPAGRVLVEQGRAGHECYVIVTGTAEVSRDANTIATLGPGDSAACRGGGNLRHRRPCSCHGRSRRGRSSRRGDTSRQGVTDRRPTRCTAG